MLLNLLEQIAGATSCNDKDGSHASECRRTTDSGGLSEASLLVGTTPEELESLNELIRFDHVYYKLPPSQSTATKVIPEDSSIYLGACVNNSSQIQSVQIEEIPEEILVEIPEMNPFQFDCEILSTRLETSSVQRDIDNITDIDSLLSALESVDECKGSEIENLETQDMDCNTVDNCSDAGLPSSPLDLCDLWDDVLDTSVISSNALVSNDKCDTLSDTASQISDDSLGSELLCDSWSDLFQSLV